MTSAGRKIDVRAVEKYLTAFMESYVIYQAKRYNIKGKQYLKTLEKYYVADIGLRYMLLGSRSTDVGHILENVIYLELIRRGYEVYVGKLDDLEVDFVCMDQKRIIYYLSLIHIYLTIVEPSKDSGGSGGFSGGGFGGGGGGSW